MVLPDRANRPRVLQGDRENEMQKTINYTPTSKDEIVRVIQKLHAIDDLYEGLESLEISVSEKGKTHECTRWVFGLCRKGLIEKQDVLIAEIISWLIDEDGLQINENGEELEDGALLQLCKSLDNLTVPVHYKIRLIDSHRYKNGVQGNREKG